MLKMLTTCAALCFACSAAQAVVVPWTSSMDQAQETSVTTPVPGASGSASGTIDTTSFLLTWNILVSGLSGSLTGLHFHAPAAPGVNAGVVVNTGGALTGSATTDATFVGHLQSGLVYINAHTSANPGGEVRGQVEPVPVPAALPLMGGAVALIGFMAARRKR